MIPEDIKEKIRKFKKLRVLNTDKTTYKFNTRNKTLYIPISETDFDQIFSYCYNLREIELCVSNIIEVAVGMFYECKNLEKIIFSKKLNLINVDTLYAMFYKCESLTYFDFSNIVTSNSLRYATELFNHCYNLKEINFSNSFYTEYIEDVCYMFNMCNKLEKINWKDKKPFNNLKYMTKTFGSCRSLKQIDLRRIDFNKVKKLDGIFYDTNPDLKVLVNDTFREDMIQKI